MLIILWLLPVIGLSQRDPTQKSTQLPPTTRPIRRIIGLNDKDVVSVSCYSTKTTPHPTYVYRYCFQGDFPLTLNKFRAELTKTDGWKEETLDHLVCLSREPKAGPVEMQALLFHEMRLLPDSKGGHPVTGKDGKGWIWISYNERVKPNVGRQPSH